MGALIVFVIELAIVVLAIAGMWKSFETAGKPRWAAIMARRDLRP
ncbi:MAG: hypothetical protein ABSB74_02330 [Tepidisphaeraceae bacterium]